MAKIINLGSPGQPRESAMSGFARTYSAVAGAKQDKARTEIMQQDATTRRKESENRTLQLSSALAKAEREEEDNNRALAVQTRKRISLRLMGKTESEQQIILDSDPIQALTKELIKPYLPEAYDEKTKRLIPDRLEYFPQTEEEARAVKLKTEAAKASLKAKQLPTLDQIAAMKSQIASSAYLTETEDSPQTKATMEALDKMEKAATDLLKDSNPNVFTSGLGNDIEGNGQWWNK